MGARPDVSDEEDRILTAVFRRCEELRATKHLVFIPTDRELASKYAISERTVRNWRREGCPFSEGQWRVLDWLACRRYAPAGAKAKFARQLRRRRSRAVFGELGRFRVEFLELKRRHREAGIPMPDWLRRMPYRAR